MPPLNSEEILMQTFYGWLQVLTTAIIPALLQVIRHRYQKVPYHTSILSGQAWVDELLAGHPERIRTELGVHKHVFMELITALRDLGYTDSRWVSLEEQLSIFLYACVTGLTTRHIAERFQRSNATIALYFKKMLDAFAHAGFYAKYVSLPTASTPIPSYLKDNPKLWPFFRHCLGAIDGSHIHLAATAAVREACRNRKGFISQNCLFACSFTLLFIYALTGWEGSASDARIFDSAIREDLVLPDGYYLLADAGFPHCAQTIVPYRGKRYHLAEWGRAEVRPRDKEELFNLRHAQARNIIERIFGVIKKRFRILLIGPEYQPHIQALIPSALAALHNFIRIHDPIEGILPGANNIGSHQAVNAGDNYVRDVFQSTAGSSTAAEKRGVDERRDRIASDMWASYQDYLRQHGLANRDGYLYDIDAPAVDLIGPDEPEGDGEGHDNEDDIDDEEDEDIDMDIDRT